MRIRIGRGRRRHGNARPMPPWVARIIGGVLMVLGLVVSVFGNRTLQKADSAEDWPTVVGRVEESKVDSRSETRDGRRTTMYSADVLYGYEVDGKKYQANDVRPGGIRSSSSRESEAQMEASKYPKGSAVTVHYDPDDPSDACLVVEAGSAPWILMAGGVLCLLVGAGVFASTYFAGKVAADAPEDAPAS